MHCTGLPLLATLTGSRAHALEVGQSLELALTTLVQTLADGELSTTVSVVLEGRGHVG